MTQLLPAGARRLAHLLGLFVVLTGCSAVWCQTPPTDQGVGPCRAEELALDTSHEQASQDASQENGASSAMLIVQNKSERSCSMRPFPTIVFADPDQRPLQINVLQGNPAFQGSPMVDGKRMPMGHGPVVLPILIAPHQRISAAMHWNAGSAAGHERCRTTSAVFLKVPDQTEMAPIEAKICSTDTASLEVRVGPFQPVGEAH